MILNRVNIYKLISGYLAIDYKKFNPDIDLMNTYNLDSFGIIDLSMLLEDTLSIQVDLTIEDLIILKTARKIADRLLDEV